MRSSFWGLSLLLVMAGCRAGHPVPADAGTDAGEGIGINGGTVSSLFFAVVGDTRPLNTDDIANYPTPVITKIYADMEAMSPRPQFVVSTGDYMNASTTGGQQLDLYLGASNQFTGGPLFPVMGNHECTGSTSSNCTGTFITHNYESYLSQMLGPIEQTHPYYTVNFNAEDGSWTAKLVVAACNAWDATQKSWLEGELAKATTYTFIARHEEIGAGSSPPCISDMDPILAQATYNLLLVGHSHYFQYIGFQKEFIIGNGGAPLDRVGDSWGYATVQQQASGFLVTEYDYQTAAPLQSYNVAF